MTIHATRLIHADLDEVWETMTSRDGMRDFMLGADVETDWRVGHPITLRRETNGRRVVDRGEVRSFDPGRRLSYTHQTRALPGAHVVTIELSPRAGGTEVTVIQEPGEGLDPATDARNADLYRRTWTAMLEKLEQAVVQ
jgi:uncharacterized protein YndB with AHSA1/START domain